MKGERCYFTPTHTGKLRVIGTLLMDFLICTLTLENKYALKLKMARIKSSNSVSVSKIVCVSILASIS